MSEAKTKVVDCSYEKCGERRIHWCAPHIERGTQSFEVPFDSVGPWYCSTECYCFGTNTSVTGKTFSEN